MHKKVICEFYLQKLNKSICILMEIKHVKYKLTHG